MSSALPRTESAIADCQAHLTDTGSIGTSIDSYLARYAVIVLCAEIESSVSEIIYQHIESNGNKAVSSFVRSFDRQIPPNASFSSVRQMLKNFGKSYQEEFDLLVEANRLDPEIARLGNAVGLRNSIAHHTPSQVTFSEVVAAYEAANQVVELFNRVITNQGGT